MPSHANFSLSLSPRASVVHLPPRRDPPATLIDFLAERFPRVDRAIWEDRFARGLVRGGDGRPLAAGSPYAAHLRLTYFREAAEEQDFGPPSIVHAGPELVVADKPPFQPVVPAGPWVRSCLLYQVAAWLEAAGEDAAELAPLHRLDRATSGLVVFCRRAALAGGYGRLFAAGEVERLYYAWAELPAAPERRSFRVASRIVEGEPFFRMKEVPGEPNAVTEIELAETREEDGRLLGLFALRPRTGKKHQLRLHLAGLGFPILGDRYYPELLPELPDDPARPLRLLAAGLSFRAPSGGESLRFASRRSV
jgi:tRNA pseudouridine32 synthase/23S rRNA pseudouridine746 synthase